MNTRSFILPWLFILIMPFSSSPQALKKLKKDLKEAVEKATEKGNDKQQNSSDFFVDERKTNQTDGKPKDIPKPAGESVLIDFGDDLLENFYMEAYKGKLLGGETGNGKINVEDKKLRFKAIKMISEMTPDDPLYKGQLKSLLSDKGAKEFYVAYNASEFETRRVWDKYKNSGLHEKIVAVSKTLPNTKEANAYNWTSFNSYDFDKNHYKILVQTLNSTNVGYPLIYFNYRLDPEKAEAFANTYPTKKLYAARERHASGKGALYADRELQNKITDYEPKDLTLEIKRKEYPYIRQILNEEKTKLYVDMARTTCLNNYSDKVDCECFEYDYRLYMLDILQSMYHPNVILYMLEEEIENKELDYYIVSGPMVRIHFVEAQQSRAVDQAFDDKRTGVSGPFKIADLSKSIKDGKLTEELYAYEAYANFYLKQLTHEGRTMENEESFCLIK